MARPHRCRLIDSEPTVTLFKPVGVPVRSLETLELRLDELEALRLADLEGLYHDAGALRMGISRPTFGRLVAQARHKVAEALLNSKALVFKGGTVTMAEMRTFRCNECEGRFEVPRGAGRPDKCPSCGSADLCRADGTGRGRRCRRRAGAGPLSGGGGQRRPRGPRVPATRAQDATGKAGTISKEESQ